MESRDSYEQAFLSYNAGFTFGHRFANNLLLETGAQYSRFGHQMKDFLLTTANSTMVSTKNRSLEISHYAGVPLMVGYSFRLKDKLRLNFLAGADANFFLARTGKFYVQWEDGTDLESKGTYTKNTGYSRFVLMGSTNLGIEYDWNEKLMWRIAPSFRYAITPVADAPIKERPYSYGLNLGVYYKLGSRE